MWCVLLACLALWASVVEAGYYTCPYVTTQMRSHKFERRLGLDTLLGQTLLTLYEDTKSSWPYIPETEGLRTVSTRVTANVARVFIDESRLTSDQVRMITAAAPGGADCTALTDRKDFGPARTPKPSASGDRLTYDTDDTTRPVVNPAVWDTSHQWEFDWRRTLARLAHWLVPSAVAQLPMPAQLLDDFATSNNPMTNTTCWGDNMDTDEGNPISASGVLRNAASGAGSVRRTCPQNVRLPACLRLTLSDFTGTDIAQVRLHMVVSGAETATPDGYRFDVEEVNATGDQFRTQRLDDGSVTGVGGVPSVEMTDGTVVTVCRQGNGAMTRYVNGALSGTVGTDTTYMAASVAIGVGFSVDDTLAVDNFTILRLRGGRVH